MAEETIESQEVEDDAGYDEAVAELERRCKTAGIELTKQQDSPEARTDAVVHMPCGREKRSLPLWDFNSIRRFLSVPFEKYVFLSDYEAICSYSDGTLEGLVRSLDRMGATFLWRRLYGYPLPGAEPSESDYSLEVSPPERPALKLVLCQASEDLQVLSRSPRIRPGLALRILGVTVSRHDDAVSLLTRLANAFFFQIEMSLGISLVLERERTPIFRRRTRPQGQKAEDIQFPKQEYDETPISLYWYGCSALGMPLLQFLAFYQVLEYYFPTYSQAEARTRISNILKNPLFRVDRDADIGQLLAAVASRGSGIGDERSQLRATLHECIDPEHLRAFLTSDEKMVEFIQKKKSLSGHKIPISNPSADLRNDVADRIYEIRCKIVHTKADGGESTAELLLPFSKEATELYHDIALVRYLAMQVLIAASSPLRLP
jgi:hypothetical protein